MPGTRYEHRAPTFQVRPGASSRGPSARHTTLNYLYNYAQEVCNHCPRTFAVLIPNINQSQSTSPNATRAIRTSTVSRGSLLLLLTAEANLKEGTSDPMACGSQCCASGPQSASQYPKPPQPDEIVEGRDECCAAAAGSCSGDAGPDVDDGSRTEEPGDDDGCCAQAAPAGDGTCEDISASACCPPLGPEMLPRRDELDDTWLAGPGCCAAEDQEPRRPRAGEEAARTQGQGQKKEEVCCGASSCSSAGDGAETVEMKILEHPDCCRGKPSPCCDVSCLDRLAARECEQDEETCNGTSTPTLRYYMQH